MKKDNDDYVELIWKGKEKAVLESEIPTTKKFVECSEESVDFNITKNIFIEGDNLDALKLLQKTHLSKIKMIYIDPPYNTGRKFLYNDTLSHSGWLTMMYPRLKLARNLLREDGVIFISIDDNEIDNVVKICSEIFGDDNFEGIIHWRRRHNQPNDPTKMIGIVTEYILAFSKEKAAFKKNGVGKLPLTGSFSNPDNDPLGDWASKPWKVGSDQSGSRYKITTPTGKVLDGEWMGEAETFNKLLINGRIFWPKNGNGSPRKKYYRFEREAEGQCATNWWPHDRFGHNQGANDEMTVLMGKKNIFSNPKPVSLISNLISISNVKHNDIILDFFSGSATTAHAVMALNAEDGGKRQHIMVQLPELCNKESETFKAGYETIAEIGKERIRRAAKRIKEENASREGANKLDIGFKVLKMI